MGVLILIEKTVVNVQAGDIQPYDAVSLVQGSASATPSSTATFTPFPTITSTLQPIPGDVVFPDSLRGDMYAIVQVPEGYVAKPYVILTAFAALSSPEPIVITGYVDSQEFLCTSIPCAIYIDGNPRIIFRAYSSSGRSSEEVIATISVSRDENGYRVSIDTINQFTSFNDSCSLLWNVRDREDVAWNDFVQFPYELNTKKTLHILARQLLIVGAVDVSTCSLGGLSVGLDWPTACGLDRAQEKMIEWQNQFDEYIWLVSKDKGIPPKILKTLIETESQFWPGNTRLFLDEYGLGQVNELGVDSLLRRDPIVYRNTCNQVLSDCSIPFHRLNEEDQSLVRGALVKSIDATCPSCEYGLDMDQARNSISLIAELVKVSCQQVNDILEDDIYQADYEDLWRFTIGVFHSGASCFIDAANAVKKNHKDFTWENIDNKWNCGRGVDYVNDFMNNLNVFDYYRYQPEGLDMALAKPTIVPTKTLFASPTPVISHAKIRVQVYIDRNNDGQPSDGEWINGMTVLVTTAARDEITLRTENGAAIFDMTGYRPGSVVMVSLPGLYRNESVVLPEQGELIVDFRFEQPTLPTNLP